MNPKGLLCVISLEKRLLIVEWARVGARLVSRSRAGCSTRHAAVTEAVLLLSTEACCRCSYEEELTATGTTPPGCCSTGCCLSMAVTQMEHNASGACGATGQHWPSAAALSPAVCHLPCAALEGRGHAADASTDKDCFLCTDATVCLCWVTS